uniref:Uncharacterized protein n=1 Tax=Xiphophorus couchianus TaxID=32473 RepID=A0A3B5MKG3_9TELE
MFSSSDPVLLSFFLNTLILNLCDMQKTNLTLSATKERVTKHTFNKLKNYMTGFSRCFNVGLFLLV